MFISSTGGHLNELLQLQPLFGKCDYHLVSEKTKSNASLQDVHKGKISFLTYGTKNNLFKYSLVFPYNCVKSLCLFLKYKPDVVVTTGAHTCVPMCYIAHFFKKKVIYIETFANIYTKTMTGKLVHPIADYFIVQWETMLNLYPNAIYGGWIF